MRSFILFLFSVLLFCQTVGPVFSGDLKSENCDPSAKVHFKLVDINADAIRSIKNILKDNDPYMIRRTYDIIGETIVEVRDEIYFKEYRRRPLLRSKRLSKIIVERLGDKNPSRRKMKFVFKSSARKVKKTTIDQLGKKLSEEDILL
jgi:hypothetical protein